jgi:hypothetical protein
MPSLSAAMTWEERNAFMAKPENAIVRVAK